MSLALLLNNDVTCIILFNDVVVTCIILFNDVVVTCIILLNSDVTCIVT